jgi:GT2 family glycosyltransferase
VDSVPFPAYTREIIAKVGFYDEEMVRNQDDEYNYRIREAGGKLLLAADVQSKYYSRGSIKKLWKQYFQYGYWKVRVLQKHPRQMSLRQFVPPAFVASLIVSLIFALLIPIFWFIFAGITGVYLFSNLLASILSAANKDWQHLFLLPIVFAILHISYGLGFLVGLVKFANRWNDKIGKVPPGKPFQA